MWWAVIIIVGVGFAIWMILVRMKMVQARELDRESILEKISTEYLKRRTNGDTMDQIRDSLYKQFSIIESEEFNPIPFGNILLASFKKDIPDDAYQLGEIAYTILCCETVYAKSREGQRPRDCHNQFDALSRVCRKCISSMVHQEIISNPVSTNYRADQSWKVDPAIVETMKQWSALEQEILKFNSDMEEARQKTLRPPPKPQEMMGNIAKGTTASDGLFGTKWLMPMEQVLQITPETVEKHPDSFSHFAKYNGQQATISYHFDNNLLTEIWVIINESSEKQFHRNQSKLHLDFGSLPAACPFNNCLLLSKGQSDGLLIEHRLTNDERIGIGITEWIEFQLPPDRRPPIAIEKSAPVSNPVVSGMIAETIPLSKAAAIAALRERALACVKCPHLAASRKNVVFGAGNIDAQIMFVGEAPGVDEDQKGEPFAGRAGQLLANIIQATGLSREDVYIAYIIKCRPNRLDKPTFNRPPTPEEVANCIPYLNEQIDLIRPKVIIVLGAAINGLLGNHVSIVKLRGIWQMYRDIPLMPTYHPAYLMRNQAMSEKRKVWEDILQVMEKLGIPMTEKQRGYFLEAKHEVKGPKSTLEKTE